MTLKDKVVIVTGSSSGIGQAIAVRFVQEGAKIVVNCHVNEKGAEETLAKVKSAGSDGIAVKADACVCR